MYDLPLLTIFFLFIQSNPLQEGERGGSERGQCDSERNIKFVLFVQRWNPETVSDNGDGSYDHGVDRCTKYRSEVSPETNLQLNRLSGMDCWDRF